MCISKCDIPVLLLTTSSDFSGHNTIIMYTLASASLQSRTSIKNMHLMEKIFLQSISLINSFN